MFNQQNNWQKEMQYCMMLKENYLYILEFFKLIHVVPSSTMYLIFFRLKEHFLNVNGECLFTSVDKLYGSMKHLSILLWVKV